MAEEIRIRVRFDPSRLSKNARFARNATIDRNLRRARGWAQQCGLVRLED